MDLTNTITFFIVARWRLVKHLVMTVSDSEVLISCSFIADNNCISGRMDEEGDCSAAQLALLRTDCTTTTSDNPNNWRRSLYPTSDFPLIRRDKTSAWIKAAIARSALSYGHLQPRKQRGNI